MRKAAIQTKNEPAFEAPTPEATVAVQVAEAGFEPVSSPARALQARLESGYFDSLAAGVADEEARWPLYLALPFWIGLASLMWGGLIAGILAVIHHL